MTKKRNKILYAASTATHLCRFHMPYIEALRENHTVLTMATGADVDFPIVFDKHYFSLTNFRSMRKIRRILKKEQFDCLILNTTLTAFWVRFALFGMKKRPYVLNVVHGYLFPLNGGGIKKRILVLCEKMMRRKTDHIAVMNREDLESAKRYRLCMGDVYFTYGMGLSNSYGKETAPAFDRSPYTDGSHLLCTFVGELSGRKNQSFLIRAVQQLHERGIPVRLLLVGEGNCREELQEQIEMANLEQDVFLLGSRQDVPSILAATDLYVSASISEGLPFNLMEAMAYGLPIVASRVRGQVDLLEHLPNALFDLADEEGFCKAVASVYESRSYGQGSVRYSNLDRYRLERVFHENMKILTRGCRYEKA